MIDVGQARKEIERAEAVVYGGEGFVDAQAAATLALAKVNLELARATDQLVLETKRATHLRR